jgi:hypothetical protein
LWVASGFGRQGLNTSAMAGQLVARSILWGDDRWRLFSPFELVWAGGPTGRVVGYFVGLWGRGSSAAAGALARHRERVRIKERIREARRAEANRQVGARPAVRRPAPSRPNPNRPKSNQPRPVRPAAPVPHQLPPADQAPEAHQEPTQQSFEGSQGQDYERQALQAQAYEGRGYAQPPAPADHREGEGS